MTIIELPDGTILPVPAAIQAGVQLHQAGRFRKAEAIYSLVLQADPNNADALHLKGLVARQLGNHKIAASLISQAINLSPNIAMFHNNLAETYRTMDRLEEAVAHGTKALALQPNFPEAHYQLAMALRSQGKLDEAIAPLEQAIRGKPDFIEAYVGLGETLHKQSKSEEALDCLQKGLSIRPDNPALLIGIGIVLGELGRHDEAIQHYKQALVIRPDVPEFSYYLAAAYRNQGNISEAAACLRKLIETSPDKNTADTARLQLAVLQQVTPDHAPEGYVLKLFDDFAQTFDQHLIEKLDYRVPGRLGDVIKSFVQPGRHKLDTLDMGCGTGLIGLELRDLSRRLVGIDLSSKMLAKACERAIYDDLITGDLLMQMKGLPQDSFDLAVSADVFIYIGKLDQVFECCRNILRPGGLFAFSLEAAADDNVDFLLHTTGRYQHSRAYIRNLSQRFNFAEMHFSTIDVRKEKNEPVPGYIYLLRKQAI